MASEKTLALRKVHGTPAAARRFRLQVGGQHYELVLAGRQTTVYRRQMRRVFERDPETGQRKRGPDGKWLTVVVPGTLTKVKDRAEARHVLSVAQSQVKE